MHNLPWKSLLICLYFSSNTLKLFSPFFYNDFLFENIFVECGVKMTRSLQVTHISDSGRGSSTSLTPTNNDRVKPNESSHLALDHSPHSFFKIFFRGQRSWNNFYCHLPKLYISKIQHYQLVYFCQNINVIIFPIELRNYFYFSYLYKNHSPQF